MFFIESVSLTILPKKQKDYTQYTIIMAGFIIESVSWLSMDHKAQNVTLPTGKNAQHGLNRTCSEGSYMYYIGLTESWQRSSQRSAEGEEKKDVRENISPVFFSSNRVSASCDGRSAGGTAPEILHIQGQLCLRGTHHGYSIGMATNEKDRYISLFLAFGVWMCS